jgi:D-serine deaminase-like pyridoxal phosphate-dependent protein
LPNGVDKILMTTSNVTANKIRRAMTIRKTNRNFIQAVDYEPNARDLNDAAKEAGVVADVVIDVAVGTRSGVPAGAQALALAKLVDKLPNLKLRGIISYDGGAQHIKGFSTRSSARCRTSSRRADLRHVQARGPEHGDLQRRRHRHLQHHDQGAGFTDLQVGSYIFMDAQYLEIGGESGDIYTDFVPSLTVMTTVLNTYFPGASPPTPAPRR